MSAKIKDVAKRAGVSISTVSRVLNNAGSVNEQMTREVLEAISELGYVPNSIAQSLKQNCSKMIGITASDLSVAFFPEIVKGVEKVFQPLGYAIIVSNTYDQPKNEKIILRHMISRQVDALLVNSTGQNEEMLKQISLAGTPVIFYDRRSRKFAFPSVYSNKKKGTYLAAEHLYDLGHRRILLLTGAKELTSSYDRYMGIQDFIFEKGLNPNDFTFNFGEFSYDSGMMAMEQTMSRPDHATAVITGSIAITAGVMQYCRIHSLSIPEDISVVSSGNFIYGDVMDAGLTYLDDQSPMLSETVTSLLEKCLKGEKLADDFKKVLEPVLHIGRSSGRVGEGNKG